MASSEQKPRGSRTGWSGKQKGRAGVKAGRKTGTIAHDARASRNMLRAVGESVTVVGLDGTILDHNHPMLAMGLRRRDAIGKKFSQLPTIGRKHAKMFTDIVARVKRGKPVRPFEVGLDISDGVHRRYLVVAKPVKDRGHLKAVCFSVRDITVQRSAERMFQQTYFAVDDAADSIFWIRSDGRLEHVNDAMCETLGYSREELLDKLVWQIDVKMTRKSWVPSWQTLKKIKSGRRESEFETRAGRVFPVEITANYHRLDEGEYACVFARDITERKRAEQALRDSEHRFRNIVQSVPMGMHMYRLEADGRLIFSGANPAADAILGVDHSRFVGKTMEDAFPALTGTAVPRCYRRVAAKGGHWHSEQVDYEDERIRGAFEVHAFQTSQGNMVAMFHDITERKRAETVIKESEEKYRLLVDNFVGSITVFDREGRLLFINAGGARNIGGRSSDYVGRTLEDLFPGMAESLHRRHARIMRSGKGGTFEDVVPLPNGEERWFLSNIQPTRNANGKIYGVQLISYDVTEERKATEEMRRLAAAVREAAESIVITDADGTILYVNPCFEKLTGYKPEEALGKNPNIVKSGKHDQTFYEELWNTITSGKTWRGHFTNRKKDGTLFEEIAVISPVRDAKGKIVNFVAVKRDVTHEMVLERQVIQSQKMAAIGQFAHKVAHDFTNVLVIIIGNARLAQDKAARSPEICKHLDEVVNAANKISIFAAELLTFAHPDPLCLQTIPLHKAMLGAEEMLRRMIEAPVRLHVDIQSQKDKVIVDPTLIEQVIVHLALNAEDAMPKGGDLTVQTLPGSKFVQEIEHLQLGVPEQQRHKGGFVALIVKDTGAGMTPEDLLHVFEPFHTTKKSTQRSGLGLATVYSIIKRHSGHITVDSAQDHGTTFKIFLPVVEQTV